MNSKSFLLPAAAALAFAATPVLAQHDHGSMHGGGHDHASHGGAHASQPSAANEIVEGTLKNGVRTVNVTVTDNGFEPSKVKAKKGEKVRLVVTRKTDSTCAKEIVIKDHGINQPLPLGKPVTVEFVPAKSGEIRYACGMDHISGVVFIP
jgi:plastocyanin